MTQRQRKATRLVPFAQFFGLAPRAEKPDDEEQDDERVQREDESDEDYAKRMKALDEQEDDAPEEDPDADDLEDPENPEDDDADAADPDGEDDEDSEDDEKDGKDAKSRKAQKATRTAERKRCAAIVAHGIKTGRTMLACSFAFDTNLTVAQAKSGLNAARQDAQASAPRHRSLSDRMSDMRTPNPGANGGKSSSSPAKTLADRITAVGESVRRK